MNIITKCLKKKNHCVRNNKILSFISFILTYLINNLLIYFSYILSTKPDNLKLSSNDILFTTVCNDNYYLGLAVLLYSLQKYNNNFTYKFKIYYQDDLSDKNKLNLQKIYKNLIFENITDTRLKNLEKWFSCLIVFSEYEYKRVIFIDSDIICLGDINDMIYGKVANLGICMDTNFSLLTNLKINFPKVCEVNTGVMVIDKKYRNKEFFEKIINYSVNNPNTSLGDQGVLNIFIRNQVITYLPTKYNCKKRVFYTINYLNYKDPKLIHFAGVNKPFIETKEKMIRSKICNNLINEYFYHLDKVKEIIDS